MARSIHLRAGASLRDARFKRNDLQPKPASTPTARPARSAEVRCPQSPRHCRPIRRLPTPIREYALHERVRRVRSAWSGRCHLAIASHLPPATAPDREALCLKPLAVRGRRYPRCPQRGTRAQPVDAPGVAGATRTTGVFRTRVDAEERRSIQGAWSRGVMQHREDMKTAARNDEAVPDRVRIA